MKLTILELKNITIISEKTVFMFLQSTAPDLISFFDANRIEKKQLFDSLPEQTKNEIQIYLNIMMNQHYKNNFNYLALLSKEEVPYIQLVRQVAFLDNIYQYLINF